MRITYLQILNFRPYSFGGYSRNVIRRYSLDVIRATTFYRFQSTRGWIEGEGGIMLRNN